MSRKREPAAGARFSLCIAMSGRGHRGKRPRGDVTRGPRTSSYTGRLHVGPASLLCDAAFCDLQRHGFAILIIAAVWSILGCSAKAAAWSLLCWLSSLASWAAAFVLVMSFSPCIPSSFLGLCGSFKSKSSLSSWQWSCLCNAARELRCRRRRRRQIHHSRPCPRPHPLPGSRQFPCSTPWPPAQLVKCVIIRSPAGMRGGGGHDECIGSGRCSWRLV